MIEVEHRTCNYIQYLGEIIIIVAIIIITIVMILIISLLQSNK